MVAGLEPSATAVINADDEFAALWRGMARGKVSTFGVANAADFSAARHPHGDRRHAAS